ncbi:hypothetical protein NL676_004771 [Syzygium grande]|nr:hypothetical protein NL676_004771 [Syzygium grande]
MEIEMIGGDNPNPMNGQANHHHAVTVATEAERDWSSVQNRLVPGNLSELNPKAYKPRIVSIGPYHHRSECVRMIEEHKLD